MTDEPFGRQPKPVRVRLYGEKPDVVYWLNELMRRACFKGDEVQASDKELGTFTIYPRAVND